MFGYLSRTALIDGYVAGERPHINNLMDFLSQSGSRAAAGTNGSPHLGMGPRVV